MKLINTLIISIILVLPHVSHADWIWAKRSFGTATNEGCYLGADKAGNIYATGWFTSSTLVFGSDTLHSSGQGDMFLVKYDPNGNVIWARSAVGGNNEIVGGIAVDSHNDIYVTGSFSSNTLSFDNITLARMGGTNTFLVKYDSSGQALWAIRGNSSSYVYGTAVAVDDSDNVFVAGNFKVNATFNGFPVPVVPYYTAYLVKCNSSGTVLWAKSGGGPTGDNYKATGVATDAAGNAYLAGYFNADSMRFDTTTIYSAGAQDMFLAKYGPSGDMLYLHRYGGAGVENINAITRSNQGYIYITGGFSSDTLLFGQDTLTTSGTRDAFLVNFDTSGAVLWARAWGSAGDDIGWSLAADNGGNVYVGGTLGESTSIDTMSLEIPYGNCEPYAECDPFFLLMFSKSGDLVCGRALPSGGDDFSGLVTDNYGDVYLGSDFTALSFVVGQDTLELPMFGTENIYMAKFSCNDVALVPHVAANTALDAYPNPTDGLLRFKVSSPLRSVRVLDVLGNLVYTAASPGLVVDLSFLRSGIYFLYLDVGSGPVVQKLLVQH
jgi:hypothetical protein